MASRRFIGGGSVSIHYPEWSKILDPEIQTYSPKPSVAPIVKMRRVDGLDKGPSHGDEYLFHDLDRWPPDAKDALTAEDTILVYDKNRDVVETGPNFKQEVGGGDLLMVKITVNWINGAKISKTTVTWSRKSNPKQQITAYSWKH